MEFKERVIKFLTDFGRMPTSRIAGVVGMNWITTNKVLEELVKEKKIKKIKETLSTNWEIRK